MTYLAQCGVSGHVTTVYTRELNNSPYSIDELEVAVEVEVEINVAVLDHVFQH